jgi:hypothetical protein
MQDLIQQAVDALRGGKLVAILRLFMGLLQMQITQMQLIKFLAPRDVLQDTP